MAQDLRREQTVRLPNPSAQPFVSALKTARFFAVLFFWVTMVCVLAHSAAFFVAEWARLYDAPAAEPVPAAPSAPAEGTALGAPSWLGLLEGAAQAAEPGELFPNVPPQGGAATSAPAKAAAPVSAPAEEAEPAPPAPEASPPQVEPPAAAPEPATLTPTQRAERYRDLTARVLRPARIVAILSSLLLAVTLFLYLQIALLGRLAGIRQLTRALFVLLLFLLTVLPWQDCFEDVRFSALYDFGEMMEAHAARLQTPVTDVAAHLLYFSRFLVMPLLSLLLLAWSGIQFAAGYGESVVANE